MNADQLPSSARYAPFASGRYEVAAGLRPLGTDFGNAAADAQVFQIDRDFQRYRDNKLACHAKDPDQYIVRHALDAATERAMIAWLLDRLIAEHPKLFDIARVATGGCRVDCCHTRDQIHLD